MTFRLYDTHGPIDAIGEPTAATIGVFDGVHRGHQDLFRQMDALRLPYATMAVTLTAHPSFVLGRRPSEYWLDDPAEHLRLLFAAGADYVAVLPFTAEVAQLSACRMARLLHERLTMRAMLLGYDSRFGNKTCDDFDNLPQLAGEIGFSLHRGEPFLVDGQPISSSRIRSSLLDGRVDDTTRLLGRPYSIAGTVQHGRGIGHTLGFPTANIDIADTRKMLPKEGVYAVDVAVGQRPAAIGMANLGDAPTFGIDKPMLEVHLIDFDGDLYGQTVEIRFLRRLRDIQRFPTPEALEQQLNKDLAACRLP